MEIRSTLCPNLQNLLVRTPGSVPNTSFRLNLQYSYRDSKHQSRIASGRRSHILCSSSKSLSVAQIYMTSNKYRKGIICSERIWKEVVMTQFCSLKTVHSIKLLLGLASKDNRDRNFVVFRPLRVLKWTLFLNTKGVTVTDHPPVLWSDCSLSDTPCLFLKL